MIEFTPLTGNEPFVFAGAFLCAAVFLLLKNYTG
jgi:hypothetical protein